MVAHGTAAPLVVQLNVEELLDAAWSQDRSRLPALSSTAQSPVPAAGMDGYRHAYTAFVERFTAEITRRVSEESPGRVVVVQAGDVLRPWWEGASSSFSAPHFEAAVTAARLPALADLVEDGPVVP